jgi:NAD(P)-dependent dehydrogenase (short-subunit alcohol dehydrogenase family)
MAEKWTHDDIPDQHGRIAVVTGSNTGIGFETASGLAAHGAHVILGVRDTEKGAAAVDRIKAAHPTATVTVQQLDLSSLDSIRTAAHQLRTAHPRLDLLIDNAGIASAPHSHTEDGFERIFGTNHLGHFALTGLVLPSLLEAPGSRVVTVSALAHQQPRGISFDDLERTQSYNSWRVYGESKLANLLFTRELQRRLAGKNTIAVAAHPGLSQSDLSRNAPRLQRTAFQLFEKALLQSTSMGALPSLRAATDPHVHGGEYYGPARRGIRGYPILATPSRPAHDDTAAARLWQLSEELTEIRFPV